MLYENLANEFARLIGDGQMRPGDRLPSVRHLARQRKLSISTVVQALRTLESRGMVEARPQSGYYVRRRPMRMIEAATAPAGALPGQCGQPVAVGVSRRLVDVLRINEAPEMVPFGSALPAPELLLAPRLNRLYASIARRQPQLLSTSSHSGLNEAPLLRAITRRALEWGCPLAAEEVVVTNSCTEAMALCLRAVTRPGDTVAVESPTYYVMLQLLEAMGLRALEIPTHPLSGVSVDALELATRQPPEAGGVAACLLIPNGANPLGSVMPDEAKAALAKLLATRGVALIEDDIYGDICFSGARPRPIHAFDESGNTMLCTSFSKTVSPGLRVGFIAAGRRAADIVLQKTLNSGKTNPLTQQVIAELMESRGFDVHLRTLRRRFAEQIARTRDAVARHFPAETRVTDPQGGFVLWLELPPEVDCTALHARAVQERIAFVPGEMFSASGQYRNCLRLACGDPWSERLEDGMRRLGRMIAG
ncbi:MAG: PLP-dependent aminotransferase family protein [Sulfuritalea sp.]|nr:PLP-dependent aminotransferase family protein [Sulfuritalea sp.]MDP1981840.1 PLP-dependent aminotransferase family protein [Sulfuritalea sp.]